MLMGNRSRTLHATSSTLLSGPVIGGHGLVDAMQARLNLATGSAGAVPALSAAPRGYGAQSFCPPIKSGTLSTAVVGSGGVAPLDMLLTLQAMATLQGQGGVVNALGALIASLSATLQGQGGVISADMKALLAAMATLTGTGGVNATATGTGALQALLQGQGDVDTLLTGIGNISATLRGYGELTPEGIRDALWDAVALEFNKPGSMGNKLNSAASGGVDYAALAAAILAVLNATTIPVDVQKVKGQQVNGTGSELDPWGP